MHFWHSASKLVNLIDNEVSWSVLSGVEKVISSLLFEWILQTSYPFTNIISPKKVKDCITLLSSKIFYKIV